MIFGKKIKVHYLDGTIQFNSKMYCSFFLWRSICSMFFVSWTDQSNFHPYIQEPPQCLCACGVCVYFHLGMCMYMCAPVCMWVCMCRLLATRPCSILQGNILHFSYVTTKTHMTHLHALPVPANYIVYQNNDKNVVNDFSSYQVVLRCTSYAIINEAAFSAFLADFVEIFCLFLCYSLSQMG